MTIVRLDDLLGLQAVGALVARARDAMLAAARPGVTTAELDEVGRRVLEQGGARSAPKLVYGFPGHTCVSVNDEAAHGIPGDRPLAEGDLVNVDVSAELDGYFADTGASRVVGQGDEEARRLCATTRRALHDALAEVRAGAPLNRIGRAVERRARRAGFAVLEDLCGHGVGRSIHEPPQVSNTYEPCDRRALREGWVLAIEPLLTTGATCVETDPDGWTLRTPDGSRVAQFEHTVVVTRDGPLVLTASQG